MLYSGVFVALAAFAAGALLEQSPRDGIGPWPWVTAGALLVAAALGPWYLRLFAFRPTYLIGHDLVIRGLWTTWRIPVAHVSQVLTRTPRGWVMVRISLDPPDPRLGAHIRVLGPFTQEPDYVAAVLETIQNVRRGGA